LTGGKSPQLGEVMPSILEAPLDALVAAFPKSDTVKWLTDTVFSDRFRDYMTMLEATANGADGLSIWSKIKENKPLTVEEQEVWASARRSAALYGILFSQMGNGSLNPDEKKKASDASALIIQDMTGYTPSQQNWLRSHGYRIWDMVGGISPTESAILQQLDLYKWQGLNTPLLPSAQQDIQNKCNLDWDDINSYITSTRSNKSDLEDNFLGGKLSPSDYSSRLSELLSKQRNFISDKEQDNPVLTLQGKRDFQVKNNIAVPVTNPMRKLMNLYFSIELKDKYDEETGELVTDWEGFYATRQAITDSIPDSLISEWESFLSKNQSPLEAIHQQVTNQYFRKYYAVWDETLKQFSTEEQSIINEYLYLQKTGQQLDRQAEIKAMQLSDGKLLISSFQSAVGANKAALRQDNPYLDAWLYYWGKVSSFKKSSTKEIYLQLCKDTGRMVD
jgi:hypothetical protein